MVYSYGFDSTIKVYIDKAINNLYAETKNKKLKSIEIAKDMEDDDDWNVLQYSYSGKISRKEIDLLFQDIVKEATRLYHESLGEYEAFVSVAIDGRIDVKIWANKDMDDEELKRRAMSEFSFCDLSDMEVIGANPVNIFIDDDDYEHDF